MAPKVKEKAKGTSAMRRAKKVRTPAVAAELRMRAYLSHNPPPVNYKTGRIRGDLSSFWKAIRERGDCSLRPKERNPLCNPKAKLEDVYMYSQDFAVNQPLVSSLPFLS